MKNRDRTLLAFGRNEVRIRADRQFSQDNLAEKADLDCAIISGTERAVLNPGSIARNAQRL